METDFPNLRFLTWDTVSGSIQDVPGKRFGDGESLGSRCQRMGLGDTAVDHTDTVGTDSADGARVRRKRCPRAKDLDKHGGLIAY